ncbi:DUF2637 domain-containing protein [Streptomyces sp. NPDC019443]|uniref:DUF2637 domain-containing protein n=1 Tax=Streptomyces sp. NPDC019443 TaxID=3365061 RepID=UPI0037B2D237
MHDRYDQFGTYGVAAEQYGEAYATLPGQWDGYPSAFVQEPISAPDLDVLQGRWEPDVELTQLLQEAPEPLDLPKPVMELRPPAIGPSCHRRRPMHKVKTRAWTLTRNQSLSYAIAAVSTVIIAMVSVLGGLFTHDILRQVAVPGGAHGLAPWWPMLVYGPWMVASLSILRAALHRRSAPHSWAFAVLFCGVAVLTCIAEAPRTVSGAAVAGLPALASMVCFHQLVRHITLTRPAHDRAGGWCKGAHPCMGHEHSESQ